VEPATAIRVHDRELGSKLVAAVAEANVRRLLQQPLQVDGVLVLAVAQMERKQCTVRIHQVD
jgi:hypothetical protein